MLNYKLPSNLDEEINDLEDLIAKFKKGEVSATEIKVRRVPFGVYEQRKKNTYMVRIRCAAACVTPGQLAKIAALSSLYGADWIHVTSRQEIQIHYVDLDNIVTIIRGLKEVGLSSRGGGGNTVRNIIAQEDAGIIPDEAFDTTPYAISLTGRIVAEPDSWNLPRKFKIAFSGSPDDRGSATISDVGFIARVKDGQKGFKVYVAGGLGAKPAEGHLLFDFVPENEVYNVTRAVKTLFFKYGNRRNKHAARLRFLWKTLGEEEFKKRFSEEYEAVKKENPPPLTIEKIKDTGVDPDLPQKKANDNADFELWKKRFTSEQKQKGLFSIILPVHLGHLSNERTIKLARFLKPFGENVIRMSKDQNFLIRNIPEKYLPHLYNFLKNTMDNFNRPYIIDKILSCAGASTCQLGICLSPGVTQATRSLLENSDLNLDELSDIKMNISGCPNSCGQHHAADLGFFGKVARKGDKVYPAYTVVAGAVIRDSETELAEKMGEIAARDLPRFAQDFFREYLSKRKNYKDLPEYIQQQGKEDLRQLCGKYKEIPDFEDDANYYVDWTSDKPFSVSERGKGECSAGLFDLIEMDFGNIRTTKKLISELSNKEIDHIIEKQQLLKEIVFYSARVLLVTRGVDPKSEQDVYGNFSKYFIRTGLVAPTFEELIQAVEKNNYGTLAKREHDVYKLAERMKFLYDHMNNAFEFEISGSVKTQEQEVPEEIPTLVLADDPSDQAPKVVKDFRGVTCPMNFVKTKMELSRLKSKDILEIWLDDGEPIENVPGSVREEGHHILEQKRIDNYWSVIIEKQ